MSQDRELLAQLLKSWAQDHDHNFAINDPSPGDIGIANTGAYLSWIIKQSDINIDLLSLLDRLDVFLETRKGRAVISGLFCKKCQLFCEFAEPNQNDGSLLCWSCKNNPYI